MGAFAEGAIIGITIKAVDEFSKTFSNASKQLDGIGAVASGAIKGVGMFAGATVALGAAFIKAGIDGSEYLDFLGEFNRMAGEDAPAVMEKLKAATLGAVSELDLLNTSNKLLTAGMQSESLPMLADFATRLGETTKEFGGVNEIMQTVGQAIATGRYMQLEQMLGGVDLAGKSTAEILDIVAKKMESMPKPTEDAGSKFQKLQATMQDTFIKVGGAVEPAVSAMADAITKLLPPMQPLIDFLGQFGSQLITTLTTAIIPLIPRITEMAQQILPVLADAFFKILDALLPLVPVFFNLIEAVTPLITMLLPPLVDIFTMLIPILTTLIPPITDLVMALMPLIEIILPPLVFLLKLVALGLQVVAGIVGLVIKGVATLAEYLVIIVKDQLQKFKDFWDGLVSVFKTVYDWVVKIISKIGDMASAAKEAIGNSFIGKAVSAVGGALGIGKHADGGIFTRPTIGMIGEAGAEAVIPLNRMNDYVGGTGGGGYTVIVQGNNIYGTDPDEIAGALQDRLRNMISI